MPLRILLAALLGCLVPAPAFGAIVHQVDSTLDAPDAAPGDGQCASAAGFCTLRAAMMEFHFYGGVDPDLEIRLPPGEYALSHDAGEGEFDLAAGDLDLRFGGSGKTLTLRGWEQGAPVSAQHRPVVTAAAGFGRRLLAAFALPDQTIRIHDVVLSGAHPSPTPGFAGVDRGASLQCFSYGGALELERVAMRNALSPVGAGALWSEGCDLELTDVDIDANCSANAAFVSFGQDGVPSRRLRLERVSMTRNDTSCFGADETPQFHAILVLGFDPAETWDLRLENVSLGGNIGSLMIDAPAAPASALRSVALRHVTFADNVPDYLGTDSLVVSGDVEVLVGHSTLGDLPPFLDAARLVSTGHSRVPAADFFGGAMQSAHATDLDADAVAARFDARRAISDYVSGFVPEPGSALVDAGDVVVDDDDMTRCAPFDAGATPRPAGPACDIGAVEFIDVRVFADGFE